MIYWERYIRRADGGGKVNCSKAERRLRHETELEVKQNGHALDSNKMDGLPSLKLGWRLDQVPYILKQ